MGLDATIERLNALKLEHRTPGQVHWVDRKTDEADWHAITALLIGTGVTVAEVDHYVAGIITTVARERTRGGFLRAAKAADIRALVQTCVVEGLLVGLHHGRGERGEPPPTGDCNCEPAEHPSVVGACACPVHGLKAVRAALAAIVDEHRHPDGALITEAGFSSMDDALIAADVALGLWPT